MPLPEGPQGAPFHHVRMQQGAFLNQGADPHHNSTMWAASRTVRNKLLTLLSCFVYGIWLQ